MTQMSRACLPPIQPTLNEKDRAQPLFKEYVAYRSAMSCLLVEAISFDGFLRQHADAIESKRVTSHPRWPQWVKWLRENVNCKPAKCKYQTLWQWLADNEPKLADT
jgi:hypothetical protein